MSDDNNEMDSVDDELVGSGLPNIDAPGTEVVSDAAMFETATQQAAVAVDVPESHAEGSEVVSNVDMDKIWGDLDVPNEHVTMDNPASIRRKSDPLKPALAALKVGIDELEAILQSRGLTNLSDERIAKLSKEDMRLVNLARSMSPMWQDVYFDNLDQRGDWQQSLLHNETKLGPGRIRPENMKDPVLAIRATFGQGSVAQVPLWNTGLWAAFRAPTVQELADFDQRARLEKMNLGRSSNGMVFSNVEVYTVETYVRFALEHVVSINYKFETGDHVNELMGLIRNRDYHQIIWGLVMAMYPDGYPFRQPCVANPDTCNHMDELLINFARMAFVDRSKFTDKQSLMMASRKTLRDRKWLEEYQSEFGFFEKRIVLNDTLTAVLRVPSLAEQISAGHIWVDGIAKATNEAFGARLSEIERIRHIMRSGELSNLRQHSHWVASFEHSTDPDTVPRLIEGMEEKDRILEMLSEMPDVSLKLSNAILQWIGDTTVAYVALPKYKCPSCQKEPEDQTHPHLIPIDVSYVFFTLAVLKISQVEDAAD